MNFFNFDIKKLFILVGLVAFPLISVNLQTRSGETPWILQPFFLASGATQNSYAGFSSGVRSTTKLYLNLINTNKENRELKLQISELKAQLGSMTELKLENERLSKLLDFKQRVDMDLLPARIIGQDLFLDYGTVTIDRGTNHGIKKGMGTIAIDGVVGYVIEAEAGTSQVLLMTDRSAVVDGIVQRSRARGIIQGTGDGSVTLSYLKRNDDLQVGDVVVTSGLDNIFPKGFLVGSIVSIKKDAYGLGQEATLQPIVNPLNLEEVFVVRNANNQDFEKLTADASATAPAPTTGSSTGP